MDSNPLIRFIDEHSSDEIKKVKEIAIENQKEIERMKATLYEAHDHITSLLKQL